MGVVQSAIQNSVGSVVSVGKKINFETDENVAQQANQTVQDNKDFKQKQKEDVIKQLQKQYPGINTEKIKEIK